MAAAENAAIAVVLSVDRGVELVVAADAHHQQFAGAKIVRGEGMQEKVGLAGLGAELLLVSGGVGQIKPAGFADSFVVGLESGNDVFDVLADAIVVGAASHPVNFGAAFKRGGGEMA